MGIRDKRKLDYLGFAVLICESRADELNKAAYGEETEAEQELCVYGDQPCLVVRLQPQVPLHRLGARVDLVAQS